MCSPFLRRDVFFFFFFPSTSLAKPDTSRHSHPQVELASGGGGAGPGLTHLLASREFRNTQIVSPRFFVSQKSDTSDVVSSPTGSQTLSKHERKNRRENERITGNFHNHNPGNAVRRSRRLEGTASCNFI